MKGRNPELKGVLTTNEKESSSRKNVGKVSLWKNESLNSKAPLYQGTIQTEKGTYRIALWKFEPKKEAGI